MLKARRVFMECKDGTRIETTDSVCMKSAWLQKKINASSSAIGRITIEVELRKEEMEGLLHALDVFHNKSDCSSLYGVVCRHIFAVPLMIDHAKSHDMMELALCLQTVFSSIIREGINNNEELKAFCKGKKREQETVVAETCLDATATATKTLPPKSGLLVANDEPINSNHRSNENIEDGDEDGDEDEDEFDIIDPNVLNEQLENEFLNRDDKEDLDNTICQTCKSLFTPPHSLKTECVCCGTFHCFTCLVTHSDPSAGFVSSWFRTITFKDRLCKNCKDIHDIYGNSNWEAHHHIISTFVDCKFKISELLKLREVCISWSLAVASILQHLPSIIGRSITTELTPEENAFIWLNRYELAGHTPWLKRIVMSCDWSQISEDSEDMHFLVTAMTVKSKEEKNSRKKFDDCSHPCSVLKCNVLMSLDYECQTSLSPSDCIDLLCSKNPITPQILRKIILSGLKDITESLALAFVPVFLQALRCDDSAHVFGFILEIAHKYESFRLAVYNNFQQLFQDSVLGDEYKMYSACFFMKMQAMESSEAIESMVNGMAFLMALRKPEPAKMKSFFSNFVIGSFTSPLDPSTTIQDAKFQDLRMKTKENGNKDGKGVNKVFRLAVIATPRSLEGSDGLYDYLDRNRVWMSCVRKGRLQLELEDNYIVESHNESRYGLDIDMSILDEGPLKVKKKHMMDWDEDEEDEEKTERNENTEKLLEKSILSCHKCCGYYFQYKDPDTITLKEKLMISTCDDILFMKSACAFSSEDSTTDSFVTTTTASTSSTTITTITPATTASTATLITDEMKPSGIDVSKSMLDEEIERNKNTSNENENENENENANAKEVELIDDCKLMKPHKNNCLPEHRCACNGRLQSFMRRNFVFGVGYKEDDMRTDYVAQSVLKFCASVISNQVLNQRKTSHHIALDVLTYNVIPLSSSDGAFEWVEDSHLIKPLFRNDDGLSQFLLIAMNGAEGPKKMKRFVTSLAFYTVVAYIMGVGDRHEENMLVTEDGYFLHIDYGYLCGADPKLSKFVVKIAMHSKMLKALGKHEQFLYGLVRKFYRALRRHHTTISSLLSTLYTFNPPISTNKIGSLSSFNKHLNKVFYLQMNEEDAVVSFMDFFDKEVKNNTAWESLKNQRAVSDATRAMTDATSRMTGNARDIIKDNARDIIASTVDFVSNNFSYVAKSFRTDNKF
eukprot:m.40610 g.40610  ORF g.40610 m.40610 type:complete len:1185 (+) comp6936_c0_seq1:264-3818(+)